MEKAIRILLVDDHELVRHGLRHMLESEEDMKVVGNCASAEEAFLEMARLYPDIVLMDDRMPGMSGIEATRSLKRSELDYDGDIIMLSESGDYRAEALAAGAAGYLIKKDVKCADLVQAIREVYWSKQSPDERKGFIEEAVELVVPPPANAARLLRFMCQLEERLLDDCDHYAGILHTVGSWDCGTVITILLQPNRLPTLLDKLGNMPDIEKVEEEPLARDVFSSFPKKFGNLPRSSLSPSKKIRVTLKETGIVGQGLVSVLN